eukprot:scaffold34989_cov118-Isochrysis_galbana.AAC.7
MRWPRGRPAQKTARVSRDAALWPPALPAAAPRATPRAQTARGRSGAGCSSKRGLRLSGQGGPTAGASSWQRPAAAGGGAA